MHVNLCFKPVFQEKFGEEAVYVQSSVLISQR